MSKIFILRAAFTIAVLAGLGGGFVYIRHLRAENVRLEHALDQAQINLKKIKEKTSQENQISQNLKERHDIIETYSEDQDGSVAPVLRDVFKRMHDRHSQ